eukprot:274650-Prymnesium_polylepis.1
MYVDEYGIVLHLGVARSKADMFTCSPVKRTCWETRWDVSKTVRGGLYEARAMSCGAWVGAPSSSG